MKGSGIWFLRFAPNTARTLFALGSTDGQVNVWHIDNKTRPLASLSITGFQGRAIRGAAAATVRHTALSHDGRHLVCCCDDASIHVFHLGAHS